jgi:hypothetical protein
MKKKEVPLKKTMLFFSLGSLLVSCVFLAGNIPTSTPKPTQQISAPVVYYYFVNIKDETPPAGSVVILPNDLILAPTKSDIPHGPDTATALGSALKAMFHDPRNRWTGSNLDIVNIALREGHAEVVLQGDIFGAGDILLVAARMQILLTVFADTSVLTAVVTINGKNIGSLGISSSVEAMPVDYVYTRTAIEAFIAENAYVKP